MSQPSPQPLYREWPHSPSHLFVPKASYIITAATYEREHVFRDNHRLCFLQATIFEQALAFDWRLEAWSILANHYHLIAQAPENADNLPDLIQAIHSIAAKEANAWDCTPERKVWWQYWDSCLTFHKSYYARLNYVHHNPVHHHLVDAAEKYPWCSMGWFVSRAKPAFRRSVLSFPYDKVRVPDDF